MHNDAVFLLDFISSKANNIVQHQASYSFGFPCPGVAARIIHFYFPLSSIPLIHIDRLRIIFHHIDKYPLW